jgi:hypothetical protein
MNAITKSALGLALLAAASACNQPYNEADQAGEDVNAESLSNDALILNDAAVGGEANTLVPVPEPTPAQPKPKAVPPKSAPKPPSPPANPHAGHDMDNMSDAEMKNMSR